MENDKNKGFYYTDMDEDVTKYGEFVSSYFAWVPPEKQKKRAKELDEKPKRKNKSYIIKILKVYLQKQVS